MYPSLAAAPSSADPWYTHRWTWLLMLGPFLVLIAGGYTSYLAYTRQDAMVVGDYYKQGKAINQELRRDRVASGMQMSLALRYDPSTGTLIGQLGSFGRPLAAPFKLTLSHSTIPEKDVVLLLKPDAQGRFVAALPMLERARWQVVAEGSEQTWRLATSWRWPAQASVSVIADPVIAK